MFFRKKTNDDYESPNYAKGVRRKREKKKKRKKRREHREGSGHITEETLIHYKQVDSQLEHRVELEFWACYVVAWFHYEFLLQRVT